MENEKSTGNKYTVKDAAIIGIFCAVMFVVFMVYSTLTGASLFYSMIFNAAGAGFDTWGPFKLTGGVQKGHPTAEEIKGAVDFFDKIEDEYGDIIVEEYAKREKRLAYEKEHPAGGLVAGVKRTAKKIANKL